MNLVKIPAAPRRSLAEAMKRHLFYSQAKSETLATKHDHYRCLALAVRDRLLQSWVDTANTYTQLGVRTASYLSAEYLLGPHLENNLNKFGSDSGTTVALLLIILFFIIALSYTHKHNLVKSLFYKIPD